MKRLILAGAALTIAFLSVSDVGAGGVVGRTQTPPAAPPHAGVRATINIDPLRVVLKLKGMTARAGTTVSATETVANASKSRLTKVTATIELERNLAVWPEHPQAIGVLGARTTQTVRWTLCARAPGTYTVVAQATGQDAAGHQFVAYSGIEILVITGGAGKCTRSSAPDPRSIIQGQSTPRPWLIAAFSPRTTTATCLFSGWSAPHERRAPRRRSGAIDWLAPPA